MGMGNKSVNRLLSVAIARTWLLRSCLYAVRDVALPILHPDEYISLHSQSRLSTQRLVLVPTSDAMR